jgi:hypothetical protein
LSDFGKKLGKKFEDMMSAASFAEAGEFETAREMLAGRKKVLLVLTGIEADTKSLKYALNTAQRTDAALEVLVTSDRKGTSRLIEECTERARAASVGLKVEKRIGCMKEAIVNHTKRRRDILCVVVESTNSLNRGCSQEDIKLEGVWKTLGCPLVLVSGT